jgi:hypothetical protein
VPTVEIPSPKYHPFEINITRARTVLGYAPENDFLPHGATAAIAMSERNRITAASLVPLWFKPIP